MGCNIISFIITTFCLCLHENKWLLEPKKTDLQIACSFVPSMKMESLKIICPPELRLKRSSKFHAPFLKIDISIQISFATHFYDK